LEVEADGEPDAEADAVDPASVGVMSMAPVNGHDRVADHDDDGDAGAQAEQVAQSKVSRLSNHSCHRNVGQVLKQRPLTGF